MGRCWRPGLADDGTVTLWNVATGEETATLSGHEDGVLSVAFSSDGTTLASAGSWDGTVRLWNVATGEKIATLEGHVDLVAFSPDGTTLASGSDDGTVTLWNVATGEETATLSGHEDGVLSVAFSSDGTMLASASNDEMRLWDAVTKRSDRHAGRA